MIWASDMVDMRGSFFLRGADGDDEAVVAAEAGVEAGSFSFSERAGGETGDGSAGVALGPGRSL
jgi:hypothetical protein